MHACACYPRQRPEPGSIGKCWEVFLQATVYGIRAYLTSPLVSGIGWWAWPWCILKQRRRPHQKGRVSKPLVLVAAGCSDQTPPTNNDTCDPESYCFMKNQHIAMHAMFTTLCTPSLRWHPDAHVRGKDKHSFTILNFHPPTGSHGDQLASYTFLHSLPLSHPSGRKCLRGSLELSAEHNRSTPAHINVNNNKTTDQLTILNSVRIRTVCL